MHRLMGCLLALCSALILFAVGCGSGGGGGNSGGGGGTGTDCSSVSVSPTSSTSFSSSSGQGTVHVSIAGSCSWTAVSNSGFIQIVGGSSGTGPGDIIYQVDENSSNSDRQGQITVAGRVITISQQGRQQNNCSYILSASTSTSFSSSAGSGKLHVATQSNCPWFASPTSSFIQITSGFDGTKSGDINYTVSKNTGGNRSGSIQVSDESSEVASIKIDQSGGGGNNCTYSPSDTSFSYPSSGGTGLINMDTQPGCNWSTKSEDRFIRINKGSGPGPGPIKFSVDPNTGSSDRTGTIDMNTDAGTQHATVTQKGGGGGGTPILSVDTSQVNLSAGGAAANRTVTNKGDGQLTITNLKITDNTNPDCIDISVTGCGSPLGPNEPCTLTILCSDKCGGQTGNGGIEIKSNGGSATIPWFCQG